MLLLSHCHHRSARRNNDEEEEDFAGSEEEHCEFQDFEAFFDCHADHLQAKQEFRSDCSCRVAIHRGFHEDVKEECDGIIADFFPVLRLYV